MRTMNSSSAGVLWMGALVLILVLLEPSLATDDEAVVSYVPPMLGSAGVVASAGSRGATIGDVVLCAVAPDHVGLTTRPAPTLYWYLSAPPPRPPRFTLGVAGADAPLLEINLDIGQGPGVHGLALVDHGVQLREDVDYRWTLSLPAVTGDDSAAPVVVSGYIRYRPASPSLSGLLNGLDGTAMPAVYARSGVWYDAIWLLSELIEENPDRPEFRRQRLALLETVPLPAVIAHDRALLTSQ